MISNDLFNVNSENQVSVEVKNLVVKVKLQKSKFRKLDLKKNNHSTAKILDDVSFGVQGGELIAVMGGSGSGKTTLLNTLSGKMNGRTIILEGSIINTSNTNKIRASYLKQTDIFLRGLTVLETLKYQADLRLLKVTHFEKLELIHSLLEILELSHLSNTIITSFTNKTNLSGGEQRRVSLAIQLINKPSILYLDEPTTGLDSSSSMKLITLLKKLSSYGITIILSIHQPRVKITKLFDKICLLAKGGRLVFFGGLDESMSYFSELPFLEHSRSENNRNFIDFIINLSVKDETSEETELVTSHRIDQLVEHYRTKIRGTENIPSQSTEKKGNCVATKSNHCFKLLQEQFKSERLPFYLEIYYLTKRSFKLTLRDRWSMVSLNGGAILLSIVYGWMFYKPIPDLAGIRSLQSALYLALEIVGFTPMFIEAERLWSNDGLNFFTEYLENIVSIPGFILSRRLGKFLLEDFPIATVWTFITYFMWGLRGGVGQFFIYYVLVMIVCMLSFLVALMSFSLSNNFAGSLLFINIFYQVQNCACGFFVNATTMPVYVRWIKYVAYCWYAYGGLTTNQFAGWNGDCPVNKTNCEEYSGDYQLEKAGYPQNFIGQSIAILLAWVICYYFVTYVALKFKNYDISISKEKKHAKYEMNEEEDAEKNEVEINGNFKETIINIPVDIFLENISLTVKPREVWVLNHDEPKLLLENISGHFRSDSVNVIMGPSGSGKSTLLNLIANRLSKFSKFQIGGSININKSHTLTHKELGKISAYVTQHDNMLIPNLTVRETLYFQAQLRLPKDQRKHVKKIVTLLIRSMGLNDCADRLIGSQREKGISGGERRRVSIAIQLLDNKKILMLDEPTSGLDSSTAYSIINLLSNLAHNGTTVILTVHQPNEKMISLFDTIMLICKGEMIYNGDQKHLVSYFSTLGYNLPIGMNITNFALDTISQGYDELLSDVQSRIAYLKKSYYDNLTRYNQPKNVILDLEQFKRDKVPFHISLSIIFKRQLLSTFRSFDILFTRVFQAVGLAIVLVPFFCPLRATQIGVLNRFGLIQEILNLYIVGILNNIALYPVERDVFYQEYKDGIYGVGEYCISYTLNELPLEILSSLIFSVLVVFGIGFKRTVRMYFVMTFCSISLINIGESIGFIVNCIFDHLGFAVNLILIVLSIAVFMGGIMSLHLPVFFHAFNWINPVKYTTGLLTNLGFENEIFICKNCDLTSGAKILNEYEINASINFCAILLLVLLIVYRLIATMAVAIKVKYII